jgi:hypothetical protein
LDVTSLRIDNVALQNQRIVLDAISDRLAKARTGANVAADPNGSILQGLMVAKACSIVCR